VIKFRCRFRQSKKTGGGHRERGKCDAHMTVLSGGGKELAWDWMKGIRE